MKELEIMKILEILRLNKLNWSYRDIGNATGCSKTSVCDVLKKCKELEIDYDKAKSMGLEVFENIYRKESKSQKKSEEIDWAQVHERLNGKTKINLQYIWQEEYKVEHPNGISYSHFCRKYKEWRKVNDKEVIMVQNRKPGKELYVDWMGDTLECVYNRETGEYKKAHFFLSTIGVSSYPYVEAFPDEGESSWIQAHVNAFKWYGGLPDIIVPDNCKTAVIKADKYEPILNSTYNAMAEFYGTGIIPARVRRPRDKGSVESAVNWLETWLLEWLRGKVYDSFVLLNDDVKKRLNELVKKEYQKRDGSRLSIFLKIDKPCLKPLPKNEFVLFETKIINKVPKSYHVEYKGVNYSVPYTYVNEKVIIHAYSGYIEIFNDKQLRIACHKRSEDGSQYITDNNHLPEKHKISTEIEGLTEEDYRNKAKKLGEHVYTLIDNILNNGNIQEKNFRKCLGIISLAKKYGNERLNKACERSLKLNSYSLKTIENILKNSQEEQDLPQGEKPTPQHENLRKNTWK